LGILGNTHPGEAINGFLILAALIVILRGRTERAARLSREFLKAILLFAVGIIFTVGKFFQAGESVQALKRALSPAEIEIISRFASQAIDANFYWLRFLAHPIFLGVLLLVAARYLLLKYSEFSGRADMPSVDPQGLIARVERISLWGLVVVPVVGQAVGLIIVHGYYALTQSLTQMAALYRADRYFIFFAHLLFFCFCLRVRETKWLTAGQKILFFCLSGFAVFSGYQVRIIPVINDWFDYKSLAILAAVNVLSAALIWIGMDRLLRYQKVFFTAQTRWQWRPRISLPVFPMLLALVMLLGLWSAARSIKGIKNAVAPSPKFATAREKVLGINLGKLIDWAKQNTVPGDLFWFDGYDDYVFKAQAQRPTLPTMSTAETPWFVRGDQAAIDNVRDIDQREALLTAADWPEVKRVCAQRQVQYLVLDKQARSNIDTGYRVAYENSQYVVFRTGIMSNKRVK